MVILNGVDEVLAAAQNDIKKGHFNIWNREKYRAFKSKYNLTDITCKQILLRLTESDFDKKIYEPDEYCDRGHLIQARNVTSSYLPGVKLYIKISVPYVKEIETQVISLHEDEPIIEIVFERD